MNMVDKDAVAAAEKILKRCRLMLFWLDIRVKKDL